MNPGGRTTLSRSTEPVLLWGCCLCDPSGLRTVHYPIGLLSISFGLDALQIAPWLTTGLTWLKIMPPAAVVNVLSHYTGAAGLIAALPTLASGMAEL